MAERLRVGIIGCGSYGQRHAEVLSAMVNEVELTAYCNRSLPKAHELSRKFGEATCTNKPDELIGRNDVDAVLIATHHDSHADLATRCAEAGKHVLIEKPLAMSVADARRVLRAVEEAEVTAVLAFKWRYYPTVKMARDCIPRPSLISAQMMDDRWPDDLWAQDPVTGGGNVVSQGCHTLDLVVHLAQSRPVRLFAEGGNVTHPDHPFPDNLAATVAFENGCVASLVQGDSGTPHRASKFSFSLFGGDNDVVEVFDRFASASIRKGMRTDEVRRLGEEGLRDLDAEFVRLASGNHLGEPPSTVPKTSDGLLACVMTEKLFHSIRTHSPQEISWASGLPE